MGIHYTNKKLCAVCLHVYNPLKKCYVYVYTFPVEVYNMYNTSHKQTNVNSISIVTYTCV